MCGGEAKVPFEPKSDRPVYCSVSASPEDPRAAGIISPEQAYWCRKDRPGSLQAPGRLNFCIVIFGGKRCSRSQRPR
ncbi:MAG: CxxC-x17-CxxC domain-containing protein [Lachnospiraceae bacterium]